MYPDQIVISPVSAPMTAKDLAIYAGLVALALTGWNMYLQSKVSSLSALWRWKDEFIEHYNDERISLVEKFATKADLQITLSRLETHLDDLRKAFDKMRERLENRRDKPEDDN